MAGEIAAIRLGDQTVMVNLNTVRSIGLEDKALEVLARSFVELEILPVAPDMKALYTEQFLSDAR